MMKSRVRVHISCAYSSPFLPLSMVPGLSNSDIKVCRDGRQVEARCSFAANARISSAGVLV